MMSSRAIAPIEIRGKTYRTARIAAAELDVSLGSIYRAARNGTLHRVGLGDRGVEPMPVLIAGRVFQSAKVAAKYYGVSPGAVYLAIDDGDPDRIARATRDGCWRSKPVTFDPVTFPSSIAASRALGFESDHYVRGVLRRGSKRGLARIMAAVAVYVSENLDHDRIAA